MLKAIQRRRWMMAGPSKRTGSNKWWFRKGTPSDILKRRDDLQALGIKVPTQEWHSLRTENRREAEKRFAEVNATMEEKWEKWRSLLADDPVDLTFKAAAYLAGHDALETLKKYEANPKEFAQGRLTVRAVCDNIRAAYNDADWTVGHKLFELSQQLEALHVLDIPKWLGDRLQEDASEPEARLQEGVRRALEDLFNLQIKARTGYVAAKEGIRLAATSRAELSEAVGHYTKEMRETLKDRLSRDYSEPAWATQLPSEYDNPRQATTPSSSPLKSFQDLLDRWKKVHQRQMGAASTIKRYPPAWFSLKEFVGHDDPLAVSIQDLRSWREWLQAEKKLSPSTVKRVHVTAIKTIYGLAAEDGHIEESPAKSLTPPKYKATIVRERHFRSEEADAILGAALRVYQNPGRRGDFTLRALRWIPWLCAYTGARVAEIAQLRKSDIEETENGVFLILTPEAGTIKTGEFRRVPLHTHVVEQGFLQVVAELPDGPLFYNSKRDHSAPWEVTCDRVAKYVRQVAKVTDRRVQPNHAWRHLFKTRGRSVGIGEYWLDAFTGHSHKSEGAKYGGVTDESLRREMDKFPRFEFDAI